MGFNRQLVYAVGGCVALVLSLAACHGASSSGPAYVPAAGSSVSTAQTGVGTDASHKKGVIISTCGKHVHIVLAGFVDCRFREPGYGDGMFTLEDHTNGLILIAPTTGNRHTKFTVTGLVLGRGYFLVKDSKGHHLRVTVRITL